MNGIVLVPKSVNRHLLFTDLLPINYTIINVFFYIKNALNGENMLHNEETRDVLFPNCPIRNVLSRVGDKWSLLVLHTLEQSTGAVRFNALQRALPDISQKVLTTTLRTLEEDGFVVRTVYAEVPPRVDYQLTERAQSFMQACAPMLQWAVANLEDIVADRKRKSSRRA